MPTSIPNFWEEPEAGRGYAGEYEGLAALVTVGFKGLHVPLEITTSSGKLIFPMFGALAEFARDLIRKCTQAGLIAARKWGRVGGHPSGLSSQATATTV